MNQLNIHLLITHASTIAEIIGAFLLAQSLWSNSKSSKIAAYNIFIISTIGSVISYFSGEGLEQSPENLQGAIKASFDLQENYEFYTLISLIILGLSSILGIFKTLSDSPITKAIAVAVLLISFISFGLIGRTYYLKNQVYKPDLSLTSSDDTSFSIKVMLSSAGSVHIL